MTGRSSFLFAVPSWAEGAARVLDLGGTMTEYNYSLTGELADQIATYLDWAAVGDDIRRAVLSYVETLDEQSHQDVVDEIKKSLVESTFR